MFLENIFRGPYSAEPCIAFYPSSFQRKTQNRIDKTSSAEIHEFCNLSNVLKNENNGKKKKKKGLLVTSNKNGVSFLQRQLYF